MVVRCPKESPRRPINLTSPFYIRVQIVPTLPSVQSCDVMIEESRHAARSDASVYGGVASCRPLHRGAHTRWSLRTLCLSISLSER